VTIADHVDSGHYYCALMTLRSSVPAAPAASSLTNTTSLSAASPRKETPPHSKAVLEAAYILKPFRQTYGFKSSLAFIFQVAAIVSSVLLSHLETQARNSLDLTERLPAKSYDDLVSAFNESYRCLLAIGTSVMIGRGVARMVYHSSRAANTPLPDDTQRLLEVVNEIVWTSTDVQHISSDFPNWATRKSLSTDGSDEDIRMERLLKEWEQSSLEGGQGK
jgi:hypothetical protein